VNKKVCVRYKKKPILIAKVEKFSKNAPYSTRGQFQV
jgi:hypothetical protein